MHERAVELIAQVRAPGHAPTRNRARHDVVASSCERPSNSSLSVLVPSSVSNLYSFSTGPRAADAAARSPSGPARRAAPRASQLITSACQSSRVPIVWSGIVHLFAIVSERLSRAHLLKTGAPRRTHRWVRGSHRVVTISRDHPERPEGPGPLTVRHPASAPVPMPGSMKEDSMAHVEPSFRVAGPADAVAVAQLHAESWRRTIAAPTPTPFSMVTSWPTAWRVDGPAARARSGPLHDPR